MTIMRPYRLSPFKLLFLLASLAINQVPISLADVNTLYTPVGDHYVGEDIPLTWQHDGKGIASVSLVAVNRRTNDQTFLGIGQSKDQNMTIHWGPELGPGEFHLILFQQTPDKTLYSGKFAGK